MLVNRTKISGPVAVIATVPIMLGRVVVRRVGWCRWNGGRIQANYAAALGGRGPITAVDYLNRPANDAVFASQVLQESCLSERLHFSGRVQGYRNVINPSSDRSSR